MFAKIIALSFIVCMASFVLAEEQATVCAKYQAGYGWSEGYAMEATIMKGTELNIATSSFDYTAYSTYVVLFWGPGQASVIEMDMPYITTYGTEGTAQNGQIWRIAKTTYCY